MTDAEFWRLAERVCTEKQVAVLRYKAAGYSKRRMAVVLDVAVGTVESHLSAAGRNIRRAMEATTGTELALLEEAARPRVRQVRDEDAA